MAEYAFDPAAVAGSAAAGAAPGAGAGAVAGPWEWAALWEDATAGVRACGKMVPLYHKPHYRLAWSRLMHPAGVTAAAAGAAGGEASRGPWSEASRGPW